MNNNKQPDAIAAGQPVGISSGNKIVDAVGQMHFEGNIIDHRWLISPLLRSKNGKLNTNALIILADVIYWHRPTIIRDQTTNQVVEVRKKFSGVVFFKDYQQWGDSLGLTKRQVRDAVSFLVKVGLITRHTGPIILPNGIQTNNIPQLTPVPGVLHLATYGTKARQTPDVLTSDPQRENGTRPTPKRRVRTESKTKNKQRATSNDVVDDDAFSSELLERLVAAGATPARAKKAIVENPAEVQRRLEYLPFAAPDNPGAWLCSRLDQEYSAPAELRKAQAAASAAEQKRLEIETAELQKRAEKQQRENAQHENNELDLYFRQLAESEREEIDETARRRLGALAQSGINLNGALDAERRNQVRKILGVPGYEDEEEI